MKSKRNILLCVAGGTPQIITETLWALRDRDDHVDEIRVITTPMGREKCAKLLLDESTGRFHQFLKDFPEAGDIKFDEDSFYILNNKTSGMPSKFDWEKDHLPDILDDTDNSKAANQICEIVRDITENEEFKIHASVAGGRKTMSLYLMAAMQLFGRKDDELSHVLVSPEVENRPSSFFYKTPDIEDILVKDFTTGEEETLTKSNGDSFTTADAKIYLANIPFIRLRGIGSAMLNQSVENYAEIVRQAQENLESLTMRIDLRNSIVKVGRKRVKMEPQQFFVYVLFAYMKIKNRGNDGFLQPVDILIADFDVVCRLISRAHGEELNYQNFDHLRSDSSQRLNYEFFMQKNPEQRPEDVSDIVTKTFQTVISDIRRIFKKAMINEEYAVRNLNFRKKGESVEALYGLDVEPNRIRFE